MKKTLSVVLALVMMFAMCVPAFAGVQIDALTDPTAKVVAELIAEQYNAAGGANGALSQTTTPEYIASNISSKIDLKNVDITTLEDSVDKAYTAAFTDLDPRDSRGNSFKANVLVNFRSNTVKAIKDAIIKSGILLAQERVTSLANVQAEIAKLIIEVANDQALDLNTADGQSKAAEYVLANIDIDSYFSSVYSEEDSTLDSNQVVNDCMAAVLAVWEDNSVVLSKGEGDATVNAASTAISAALNVKLTEMAGGNSGGTPGSISEWLQRIFENFTDGDFNEMFNGFGDAIKKIGSSLSDLIGGLFGGGDSNTTTTTKKPSSNGTDGTNSIPKTGDVALYSVAALSVAAGIALVLTKKKNNDK